MNVLMLICWLAAPPTNLFEKETLPPSKAPLLIHAACFAPEGERLLLAGTFDATPYRPGGQIWDLRGKPRAVDFEHRFERSYYLNQVFPLSGGRVLAGNDSEFGLWNANGQFQRVFIIERDRRADLLLRPKQERLVRATHRRIQFFDAATGNELESRPRKEFGAPRFSPDGATYATIDHEDVDLWETSSGRLLRTFGEHASRVQALGFSSDGKKLLTSYTRRQGPQMISHLTLWETASGRELSAQQVSGNVTQLALLPDGRHVVVSGEASIRVLNLNDGGELGRLKTEYTYPFDMSPDGRWLMIKSYQLPLKKINLYRLNKSFSR